MITQTSSYDELPKKTCPNCGCEIKPVELVYELFGKVIYPSCECIAESLKREQLQRELSQRRIEVERLFADSELGPRFRECTLANWIQRQGSEKVYLAVKEFIEKWPAQLEDGQGLVILGPPGNGKSHLAAACVNAVISQGYPAIFQPVTRLMYRLNASYRDDSRNSEADIIGGLIEADLVVLDDVGAEKWTEKVEERLYSIIDGRYWGKKPTIITGNFRSLKELQDHIGERAFDRLAETCAFVENRATSYRIEKARAKLKGA